MDLPRPISERAAYDRTEDGRDILRKGSSIDLPASNQEPSSVQMPSAPQPTTSPSVKRKKTTTRYSSEGGSSGNTVHITDGAQGSAGSSLARGVPAPHSSTGHAEVSSSAYKRSHGSLINSSTELKKSSVGSITHFAEMSTTSLDSESIPGLHFPDCSNSFNGDSSINTVMSTELQGIDESGESKHVSTSFSESAVGIANIEDSLNLGVEEDEVEASSSTNQATTTATSTFVQERTDVRQSARFYDLLGVDVNATTEEINMNYKKIAFSLHPDKASSDNDGDTKAKKFVEVNHAYETLRNPVSRQKYDMAEGLKELNDENYKKAMVLQKEYALQYSENLEQTVKNLVEEARQRKSVIILRGIYGDLPRDEFDFSVSESCIDVTKVLQASIDRGGTLIIIPTEPKTYSWLPGFYDPLLLQERPSKKPAKLRLRILYNFRDVEHFVEYEDGAEIRIPMRGHNINEIYKASERQRTSRGLVKLGKRIIILSVIGVGLWLCSKNPRTLAEFRKMLDIVRIHTTDIKLLIQSSMDTLKASAYRSFEILRVSKVERPTNSQSTSLTTKLTRLRS